MNIKKLNEEIDLLTKSMHESDYTKEWELYRNGSKGSFMEYLAKAFQQADMKNAKKLYNAFPEVGKLFMLWKTNGEKDTL